jgi:hypothetical protein
MRRARIGKSLLGKNGLFVLETNSPIHHVRHRFATIGYGWLTSLLRT